MAKLEGIIYKAFGNYIVLRGFAQIGELASVSRKPESYQRDTDDQHKRDIIKFLQEGSYTYFPELILANRSEDFSGLIENLKASDDVEWDAEIFVKGLKVLKERVPAAGYRARHAFLNVTSKILPRIDGNHRLEPFDEKNEWWDDFIQEPIPSDLSDADLRQWKDHKVKLIKDPLLKKIVPFVIVISDANDADRFEAGIFNNVNFKQLPLKQEKNLQNIYKYLRESEELGDIHELTMELIDLAERGYFDEIPLFSKTQDQELFRTASYRILSLLNNKKKEMVSLKSETDQKLDDSKIELEKIETEIATLSVDKIKEELNENKKISDDAKKYKQLETRKEELRFALNKYEALHKNYRSFIRNANKIKKISEAIQLVRPTYKLFKNKSGNIALLSALVYYKLFNETKYQVFVDWVINNRINEIVVKDDLPIHTSDWLINMFERVFESKGMEIFISMQFNDDQSEMIFEKIDQTIKEFNIKRDLNIKLTPIRVDRTIAPHAFTISDEILKAIKNSSLIIADLSSGNKNVYHEIGYAMGLAQSKDFKPRMILLYKENTTFNKKDSEVSADNFIGFNLRGMSQLRFTKYEELTDGLMRRLEKHFEE